MSDCSAAICEEADDPTNIERIRLDKAAVDEGA